MNQTTRSLSKKLENVKNCIEGDTFIAEHNIGEPEALADYIHAKDMPLQHTQRRT